MHAKPGHEPNLCLVVMLVWALSGTPGAAVAAPMSAEDGAAARAAAEAGDYVGAAAIWGRWAAREDAVAQYNLGLLYESGLGVPQDTERAKQWFARAAKNGLVEGYNHPLPGERPAIQPGKPSETWDPEQWIARQDPDRYTLQLASSKSLDLIQKYIADNDLQGRAGYYKSSRKGETWYALVLGAYATPDEATAAASTLPEQLSKWSPWVRNIKDIHRVMQR
ncbi:MAG: hypothetical protein AMJ69_09465 [Gammaproteobacteria bacterium SG8_47]|nr:MAG: hypothetical protein AMJ69_09465 [Gammaproteobacteria bacterium SG8_47]